MPLLVVARAQPFDRGGEGCIRGGGGGGERAGPIESSGGEGAARKIISVFTCIIEINI